MDRSDAENGDQENATGGDQSRSPRSGAAAKGGRRVPTPADVFRNRRPATAPRPSDDQEGGSTPEESSG